MGPQNRRVKCRRKNQLTATGIGAMVMVEEDTIGIMMEDMIENGAEIMIGNRTITIGGVAVAVDFTARAGIANLPWSHFGMKLFSI